MVFIHSFDEHDIFLFLLHFELFLFLDLIFPHSLGIGALFKKIFGWSSVMNLSILHFDPQGSLTIDLKDIFNKVLPFMKLFDILLLQQSNSS